KDSDWPRNGPRGYRAFGSVPARSSADRHLRSDRLLGPGPLNPDPLAPIRTSAPVHSAPRGAAELAGGLAHDPGEEPAEVGRFAETQPPGHLRHGQIGLRQ